MSTASVTSSKRENLEKTKTDLIQEIDGVKTLNNALRTYLDHLKTFKKNLSAMNDNLLQLEKVNTQWIEVLNKSK